MTKATQNFGQPNEICFDTAIPGSDLPPCGQRFIRALKPMQVFTEILPILRFIWRLIDGLSIQFNRAVAEFSTPHQFRQTTERSGIVGAIDDQPLPDGCGLGLPFGKRQIFARQIQLAPGFDVIAVARIELSHLFVLRNSISQLIIAHELFNQRFSKRDIRGSQRNRFAIPYRCFGCLILQRQRTTQSSHRIDVFGMTCHPRFIISHQPGQIIPAAKSGFNAATNLPEQPAFIIQRS